MEDKKKVIVYVDGFNFYYGLKSKKWKMCYWLDLVSFFNSFLKSHWLEFFINRISFLFVSK